MAIAKTLTLTEQDTIELAKKITDLQQKIINLTKQRDMLEHELYTERALSKKLEAQLRLMITQKDKEIEGYKQMIRLYQEQLKVQHIRYETKSFLEKLLWLAVGYMLAKAMK